MKSFVEQIQRVNTDYSNCSPLSSNKKLWFTRKKTNLEKVDQNLMFNVCVTLTSLAIIETNHRLNAVNNLQSRPTIKTINSCINNPLPKQACFIYFSFKIPA